MNSLNGGYAMIKYNSTQEELAVAYKTKRPILLYDEDKRAHWAQINEKVIETVDEETQETITTYEYSYQLLNAIDALVDDSGNPRFIEGNGIYSTKNGVHISYCKWSLSGTHLMLVLAGSVDKGTTFQTNEIAATYNIPEFIYNKVVVVFGANLIEIKNAPLYASSWATQTMAFQLRKDTSNVNLNIRFGELTLTDDRTFRLQFDLLIDTE